MISPTFATILIIAFVIVFGILLPALDKKAPKYISYRWCVVVVILALLIGAVVDFNALSDDARHIILTGGLIIVGVYVGLRTLEKILANGWHRGASVTASKGDIKVEIKAEGEHENLH